MYRFRLVIYWTDGDKGHTDPVSSLEDVHALEGNIVDQWNSGSFVAIKSTVAEVFCPKHGWRITDNGECMDCVAEREYI